MRPADTDDTEDEDPVSGLEWDPLSTEYLLIARAVSGVCLVDTDNLSVIQQFSLPSAAAVVQTIAWLNNAPGMFITGGNQRIFILP